MAMGERERESERARDVSINIYNYIYMCIFNYIYVYLSVFAHLLHDFCWVFVWAHLGELSSKLWNPGDKIWAELPSKGWGDLAEWIVHGTCLARKKLGCKQPKKKTSLRVIPAPAHYSDIVSDTIWKYIYIYDPYGIYTFLYMLPNYPTFFLESYLASILTLSGIYSDILYGILSATGC